MDLILRILLSSVAVFNNEPTASFNFITMAATGVLDSRITFSAPSLRTMFDSTGKLTYCPNNLFLNTATLSTQNVTTASINYIISFKGTGTLTLTGTSTAGPIVGTGVSNRVFLKITPTAGTLTCTVSGSITEAQIEAVTYETSPRTYNATTSAAYYGPRFDYSPTALTLNGFMREPAATNLITNSSNQSSWTAFSATQSSNVATAPDGTVSADKIVEVAGSSVQTRYNTIAGMTASAVHTASVYFEAAGRD